MLAHYLQKDQLPRARACASLAHDASDSAQMPLDTPPTGQATEPDDELERLRRENQLLWRRIAELVGHGATSTAEETATPGAGAGRSPVSAVTRLSSEADKVRLMRRLFAGRDDVYAVRWERPDGRAGYAPARGRVRPSDGSDPETLALTDEVLRDHLLGRVVVGIYPMLRDERCWFLAADFDKGGWINDARAYLDACAALGVPAVLERSRSGAGAHVWIFFERSIVAAQARRLGAALLTLALERRDSIGLDSYDRLFPSQDTLPRGGFGNLIALPLQGRARRDDHSVFVDAGTLGPYEDQWSFLSSVRRMSAADVDQVVRHATRGNGLIGVALPATALDDEDPWTRPPDVRRREPPITEPLPARLEAVLGGQVFIERQGLPPTLINRLRRIAAFQNPDFYAAQAMRLSTYGKPRIIDRSEDHARFLALPRGCADEAIALLRRYGIWVEVIDKRKSGQAIACRFVGELDTEQRRACGELLRHDAGVLAAPTGFGKTVLAAAMIAARGVNTLVVVHRRHLLDQWREQLATFLELPEGALGEIRGGRRRATRQVDLAVLQSLVRQGTVSDEVLGYGHVIVDECHHIPAVSFERVLQSTTARYVLGLTATPVRKDGHHPIIVMQCGPVRVRATTSSAPGGVEEHRVIPHATSFAPSNDALPVTGLYRELAVDARRTQQIARDVVAEVAAGRHPLVLTERTEHLTALADALRSVGVFSAVLRGGMAERARKTAMSEIRGGEGTGPMPVIIATGRYAGEGFDEPRLDTLFLAMPISWRGTLQQYAGRLHRRRAGKTRVVIHDYVDMGSPVLARMYERRLRGYRAMGYVVDGEPR